LQDSEEEASDPGSGSDSEFDSSSSDSDDDDFGVVGPERIDDDGGLDEDFSSGKKRRRPKTEGALLIQTIRVSRKLQLGLRSTTGGLK